MQVIYKLDKMFIAIYSLLILVVGIGLTVTSGNWAFLAIMAVAESIYLFYALRRPFRRYRALKQPLPEEWKRILNEHSLIYRNLDEEARERFERDVRIVMGDCSIEGIRRHQLDEKTKFLVAMGFATVLNGRPDWEPPIKDGVLVYPGHTFNRDYEIGRGMRAGQATVNSPLIVTQQSLNESFIRPDDGFNVIFHELAHYFDFEDGVAEGIPGARMLQDKLAGWRKLVHEEWENVSNGYSFLRPYAATNEAETFAVAVEAFFEIPAEMYRHNPQLYNALKDFFNLDTLKIIEGEGAGSYN